MWCAGMGSGLISGCMVIRATTGTFGRTIAGIGGS